MASTTIELEDVPKGHVHYGIVNAAFVNDNDHHEVPKPHYGVTTRNNNSRKSINEAMIPDLDESGFQPFRQHVICPYCKSSVITDVHLRNGSRVWMTFFMFVIIGFCLIVPLFFCYIAFLMDWLKDVYHYCPECKNRLGKYTRK